jgi:HEAT repeat protein
MRAASLGKKKAPQYAANIRAALNSPETRARISAASTGRKHTPEACAKISAAALGVIKTPAAIAKHRATMIARGQWLAH